jgi:hypothetical protein
MGIPPPMEASSPVRIGVHVPGELVEITLEERDFLLEELCFAADCKSIRERFEVGRTTRPLVLDGEQRLRLRAVLASLEGEVALPDGLSRLLAALERAPVPSVTQL